MDLPISSKMIDSFNYRKILPSINHLSLKRKILFDKKKIFGASGTYL
jgi:hypothetical protein